MTNPDDEAENVSQRSELPVPHPTLNESTKRALTLVELSNLIRDIDDPTELAYAAAELLGRTLQVSRAGYGTINTSAETITIERDWNAPGIRSIAGVLHFRDYGSYIEDLKEGRTAVVADADKDPERRRPRTR